MATGCVLARMPLETTSNRSAAQVGYVPGVGLHKPTAKGGFGEQLLRRMGWSEGKGLGIKEDGMADAITVKKKEDQTGVPPPPTHTPLGSTSVMQAGNYCFCQMYF